MYQNYATFYIIIYTFIFPKLQSKTLLVFICAGKYHVERVRLQLIVEAHIENKIKIVDGFTVSFMNAIHHAWNKD